MRTLGGLERLVGVLRVPAAEQERRVAQCSCCCLGRPSVRSSTSLTARKAIRSSSEPSRRLSRASARSRSSGSAATKSPSSAPSNCSLSSLRLRIFPARTWPPRARSSRVNAWAAAPFLSRRACPSPAGRPAGPRGLCEPDCMLLIVGVLWTMLWEAIACRYKARAWNPCERRRR
jgi:hypothetical protein